MNPELSASIAIKNRNNVWVEDSMVSQCFICKHNFSFWLGKHHCRICGNIACRYCSSHFIVIPEFIEDKPEPADIWNLSFYISYLRSEKERVCDNCYAITNQRIGVFNKIVDIFNNPITLDSIKNLSDSDVEVKKHYFDKLRNIQYYLPNHNYNEVDKKLLKVNAAYFSRHSKYLVHLIKSIDFLSINRIEDTNFIMSVLNSDSNKTCYELYCTRTCHDRLSIDDCINILYKTPENLPDELLNYLFNIINNSPDDIIIYNLPFFINLIKNNGWNKTLIRLLKTVLGRSVELIYQTFWHLSNHKESANDRQLIIIRDFINSFDSGLVTQMSYEYSFFLGLVKNLSTAKQYLETELPRYAPISLPYNPRYKIVDADLTSISSKPSKSQPVVITFSIMESINGIIDTTKACKIRLLFKKECIMKDVTVLNLMSICNELFKEESICGPGAITYPVMPLTASSGMIEIVDNAQTLYEINSKGMSISNFIGENNENSTGKEVTDKYMYSLVTYTLYSYLIGIGDRHRHNIMLSNDGSIFNIDFDYILGKDAYQLYPSEIRIDSEMIEALHGHHSVRYKRYIDLCSIGIVYLRKYFNIFFILLNQCESLDPNRIEKFIMTRFQPRQVDDIIIDELKSIIQKSDGAYTEYFRDLLHYHTQEKTIQNGIYTFFQLIYSIIKK